MFPLFETVRIEDGRPLHLGYHNDRMNRSRRELFGSANDLDLGEAIRAGAAGAPATPGAPTVGVVRCRVAYGESVGEVSFAPYTPRHVRSLAIVDGSGLEYAHKFADRSGIERLLAPAAAETGADDILIVKRGLVTDASHANVAFFDGSSWVTPASPLLPGTTRARLLEAGALRAAAVRPSDLRNFASAALMNAMIGFDTAHPIAVADIAGA